MLNFFCHSIIKCEVPKSVFFGFLKQRNKLLIKITFEISDGVELLCDVVLRSYSASDGSGARQLVQVHYVDVVY